MKTTSIAGRLLRTGSVVAVAAAVLAAGALTATPAHAAIVDKQLALTAAPKATTVRAFADVGIAISWTGCYVSDLGLEELTGGTWKPLGNGYASAGTLSNTCQYATSRATVSLAQLLGYSYANQRTTLSLGTHTLRLRGEGYFEKMPDGSYWDVGEGVSKQFTLTVAKAVTTITGWSKKTITVKPGGSFTLPGASITNPGGSSTQNNLVVLEANEGFGWLCVSGACDSYSSQVDSDATVTASARKLSPGKNWTLQTQFRYRVLPNAYVTGKTSPVITVKFTKGISKSKSTKTTLSKTGTQQYGKKQATFKAKVSSSKASGVVGFIIYRKSPRTGTYESVYSPSMGPVVKKGKATYKFGKSVAKKGSYVVVANFQSKKPSKYRDSISKTLKFTVK